MRNAIAAGLLSILACGGCASNMEKKTEEIKHVVITQEDFDREAIEEANKLYSTGYFIYRSKGDVVTDLAASYFFKTLQRNSKHVAANYLVGKWLLRQRSYDEAKDYINKAIENSDMEVNKMIYRGFLKKIDEERIEYEGREFELTF